MGSKHSQISDILKTAFRLLTGEQMIDIEVPPLPEGELTILSFN